MRNVDRSPLPFISFGRPDIGEAEERAVLEVLRSGWLTTGPVAKDFERLFSATVGAEHALAVSSCTAGLHLALAACGVQAGDEVITTPLTFCATVNTILQVGATPVLADIGDDFNISPGEIERRLTKRTKAIVPVHLGGLPCDMQSIWEIASSNELFVIEDAAHAVGSEYMGRSIGGGKSDAVVFSFYATKNLSTGEGGMVTTPSPELLEKMRRLSLHGINRMPWYRDGAGTWSYSVEECGFKYNMPDILAAIGLEQLKRLEAMTKRRAEIAAVYNRAFAGLDEVELPPVQSASRHCWHLYILRLNLDTLAIDRAQFIDQMHALGIGCSVHFIPIPLHPYYKQVMPGQMDCPRALREFPRLVSLPLRSGMTGAEVTRVVDAVHEIVARARKSRAALPDPVVEITS